MSDYEVEDKGTHVSVVTGRKAREPVAYDETMCGVLVRNDDGGMSRGVGVEAGGNGEVLLGLWSDTAVLDKDTATSLGIKLIRAALACDGYTMKDEDLAPQDGDVLDVGCVSLTVEQEEVDAVDALMRQVWGDHELPADVDKSMRTIMHLIHGHHERMRMSEELLNVLVVNLQRTATRGLPDDMTFGRETRGRLVSIDYDAYGEGWCKVVLDPNGDDEGYGPEDAYRAFYARPDALKGMDPRNTCTWRVGPMPNANAEYGISFEITSVVDDRRMHARDCLNYAAKLWGEFYPDEPARVLEDESHGLRLRVDCPREQILRIVWDGRPSKVLGDWGPRRHAGEGDALDTMRAGAWVETIEEALEWLIKERETMA